MGTKINNFNTQGDPTTPDFETKTTNDAGELVQHVNVDNCALPTGAATAANQSTANASLASIDGKLTNPLPVSMSSAPLPTGAATEATLSSLNGKVTACNTGAVTISAALPAGTNNIGDVDVATLPALPAGTNNIGDVDVLTVNGVAPAFGSGVRGATVQRVTIATDDVVPASQSGTWNITNVSGTVSLPTGAATAALQTTGNSSLSSIDGKITAVNTGAVTISSALPAGANNIGDVDVLTINGVAPAFGSGVRGATVQRVTIATDDVVPASQSGTWNITNVSGTVSLPTGAATAANQSTEITSLQLIDDVIFTDDAAFTPASSKVAMIGAQVDDTATDSVDEGDAGALRMSANRNLYVRIRDNAGNERGLNIDTNGELGVSAIRSALPAGTNNIGDVDVLTLPALAAGSNNIGDVDIASFPEWSSYTFGALSTTVQTVKGSAGSLGGWFIYNPNSSVAYVQIFDVSGTVTLGTTTPTYSIGIPATSAANLEIVRGATYANAIKIAATTTRAGSSAPGTGLDVNFLYR